MKGLRIHWALRCDGISGNKDSTYQISKTLYDRRFYLKR